MSAPRQVTPSDSHATQRRKWIWITLAATVCLLSWLALAVGIVLDAGTSAMFVLATLAAVTTEGTVWLAALLLGVSVYQARRRLWEKLRSRVR
jgi:predicted transporter